MARTVVIAEPGCTHQGDYHAIRRLIETAAECGADVFKNQWTSDPAGMVANRKRLKLKPPKGTQWDDYLPYYTWLAYPVQWHHDFARFAHELGMKYASSTYLAKDVALVEPYVDAFKVSSYEAMDLDLLHTIGLRLRPMKPLWISDGKVPRAMAFDWPLIVYGAVGFDAPVGFFHCVSEYPADLRKMRLRGKLTGGDRQLSDHSRSLATGAVAVACGAFMVETHFRLDDCDPANPDYAVAFSPIEFTQYIQNIRDAEVML
jgi:N,N'-diacetyllegionaminate synthase